MKKEYKLLVIGFFGSVFIIDFVKHLKKTNPNVHIYYWGFKMDDIEPNDHDYINCFDDYCSCSINHRFKGVPILQQLETIVKWRRCFKSFVKGRKFDIINIQFIRPSYLFILDYLKRYSSKIVLTPWGSDIYRHKKNKYLKQILINTSDYITGKDGRFFNDIRNMYHVSNKKVVSLCIGNSTYDYILENRNTIDTVAAKFLLGLQDAYVITCGYNAMSTQNHLIIVDAINNIKDKLPNNLVLLFPFTYGRVDSYIDKVKQKVKEYNLRAVYFEQFLNVSNLFLVRQSTDIFIHYQTTDAASGSVREYLLCGKKVINGDWIKYDDLELNGYKPYFIAGKTEPLENVILKAYNSKPIEIPEQIYKIIEQSSWKNTIRNWDSFFAKIA